MILTFVVWGECFNLFNSLSMKHSLMSQLKHKSMFLPVAMTLIPVSALTVFMYVGSINEGMDLIRLTPLQYGISVLLGFMIIPVVETFKIYVRWSARRQTRFSRFFRKGMEFSMSGMKRINDMPANFQKELEKYYPGYYLGKGITFVGKGIKKAVGPRDNNKKK
jgi:hypothetical protein